ncbi:helix-turn-helix domain-containing protein [Clostridium thailandense]|uniref:helix-turn-helix domain-containing protein n=1 Tax=Clostridium thailandense TaxID=2794346 RepID=UPI00398A2BD0
MYRTANVLGTIIREVREHKGMTQEVLGQVSFLSDSTISAIETGRRALTQENLEIICKILDDPRLYFEVASKITDNVFNFYWLDGEAADLHRASVKEKIIEELDEAIKAIALTKTYKNPTTCNDDDIKNITKSIQETIDVFNASAIYIAVMCREFNLDIKELFNAQKKKLINRGYLREEKEIDFK